MERKRALEDLGIELQEHHQAEPPRVDPLDELLFSAAGYPLSADDARWQPGGTRLRALLPRAHAERSDTVIGAVYWVSAPEGHDASDWAQRQPWAALLTCQPHKNSLAPGAPKSFSVRYSHASKPAWVGMPRFLGMSLFGVPQRDVRSLGLPMQEATALKSNRPLRDYQQRARAAALQTLETWGGATIIADCGAGACGAGTRLRRARARDSPAYPRRRARACRQNCDGAQHRGQPAPQDARAVQPIVPDAPVAARRRGQRRLDVGGRQHASARATAARRASQPLRRVQRLGVRLCGCVAACRDVCVRLPLRGALVWRGRAARGLAVWRARGLAAGRPA